MRKIAIVLTFVVAGSAWAQKDSLHWKKKMQSLRQLMVSLLPDLTSEKRFVKNQRQVKKNVQALVRLSGQIHKESSVFTQTTPGKGMDPSMKVMAALFSDELKRANEELKRNNPRYARSILRTTTQYCMACHTRNEKGPHFQNLALPKNSGFSLFEKAQFLGATRQYEAALQAYSQIIKTDSLAKESPFQWEESVYQALIISVRVQQDPKVTLELLDSVMGAKAAFSFLKSDAQKWKIAVNQWKSEQKPEGEDLLHQAKELIKKGRHFQEYPADRAGLIYYLRASALLHDYLGTSPTDSKVSAEAMFLLGRAYESIKGFRLWTIHELFYASCIYRAPHTEVAKECFDSYEQSISAGYSGSAGTFIPSDVKKTLNKLRILAQ